MNIKTNSGAAKKAMFPLGIIDLGAHAARLEIFQQYADGTSETLEILEIPVNIGYDVFTKGTVSPAVIKAITAIMKDFRTKLREYRVKKYCAIATSAMREASNRNIIINRIRTVCKIQMEILESSQESRLIYLALKNNLGEKHRLAKHDIFFLTLGTGSSNVSFSHQGKLLESKMFNFGTTRLREESTDGTDDNAAIASLIDTFAETLKRLPIASSLKSKKTNIKPLFVCAGAIMRVLLKLANQTKKQPSDFISNQELIDLREQLEQGQKPGKHGLIPANLMDGLMLSYQLIRHICTDYKFNGIYVAGVTTRQALLEELSRKMINKSDPFVADMISVAKALGKKYNYEQQHGMQVATLSMKIFDALRHLHKLNRRHGVLLQIAAIIHDIGRFVDCRSHHKHSYYIIGNSQLPGLNAVEVEIVALVARYHRKSVPKSSHAEYMQLSIQEQVTVCKLAAIIRVADALDRSHRGHFSNAKVRITRSKMIIESPEQYADNSLELIFLKRKQQMFCDTFGLKIEIR